MSFGRARRRERGDTLVDEDADADTGIGALGGDDGVLAESGGVRTVGAGTDTEGGAENAELTLVRANEGGGGLGRRSDSSRSRSAKSVLFSLSALLP